MISKEIEELKDMTPKLIGETWRKYPTESSNRLRYFGIFECQYCGTHWESQVRSITGGDTKSCGCQKGGKPKHGLGTNKFYDTWHNIIKRCTNPKNINYKNYGARGITVCEEWLNVSNFVAWCDLTHPNIEGLTLDRIDNDKGYNPENCRWADRSTQGTNQRMKSNNTSGYIGVRYYIQTNSWVARITVNNILKHIGYYETIEEAVQARDNYIIENNLPHKLSTEYIKEK